MKVSIIMALGLMAVLLQPILATEPQTNAFAVRKYYAEGGRNDPFMNFASYPLSFRGALDRYDRLPSSASQADRITALNEVRLMAAVLLDEQLKFTGFFVKSHLPLQALAVSKPLFDALKDEKFQEKRDRLVPYLEEWPLQTSWFERMDIDHLRRLYALYAALPFPTDTQLSQYRHAWDSPASGSINAW